MLILIDIYPENKTNLRSFESCQNTQRLIEKEKVQISRIQDTKPPDPAAVGKARIRVSICLAPHVSLFYFEKKID